MPTTWKGPLSLSGTASRMPRDCLGAARDCLGTDCLGAALDYPGTAWGLPRTASKQSTDCLQTPEYSLTFPKPGYRLSENI